MDAENTRDPVLDGRMLRRAENLLTTNGKHCKHTENEPGADPLEDQRLRRQTTFGGSLMRKLQEVKADASRFLSRSRSLHGRSPPNTLSVTREEADGIKNKKGHARSLSEVSQARPSEPGPSNGGPAAINTSGLGLHQRVLFDVAEQDPAGVVLSPVGQLPPDPPEVRPDGDVVVPQLLQLGTPMTKVSAKKHKKAVFRLDADLGQIVWESKQHKIIPIENIKEIRTGKDARYYREQFQLSQDYEDRWLTIIYMMDNNYKTLHLIVATKDVFKMWETTLRQLHAIRQELMTGLGNLEMRQTLWEKQYWKNADEERDQKLTFEEITKLCKRLNINSSVEDLYGMFKQADPQNRGYLDFEDFRRFVKLLKGRPEIRRIYNKLKARNEGVFNFSVFEAFMREKQQSTLSQEELRTLYNKYTKPKYYSPESMEAPDMSVDAFTSFLLSPDNGVFSDQHAKVHDMTRPLSEYFISSSHNTYLVGHQLVGDSTIEGYIRALLHSCRSVEVDIYDGDTEPMITHGKTFTSKVSLREVCEAIKKYGFVASPYPIIISAEVHCSVPQQDMIAEIMISVFGDSLVREPPEGPPKIEVLPSPEELKGKIMLKTKNLLLAASIEPSDSEASSTDPSASSASASETEFTVPAIREVPPERKKNARRQSDVAKLGQAVLQRVRSIGKTPPSPLSPSTSQGRIQPRIATGSALNSAVAIAAPLSARRPSESAESPRPKPKMSLALVALLVYTVGVKCRGLNKKEVYAPQHMFSLSETTLKRMMMKVGTMDLIKHTRTHLVRTYPKGTRVSSSNYEPHRFWATGAQLVALNWQTFDLGYMINHAMFQRNGRSGYVLKPLALRAPNKDLLMKQTTHVFQATIISAQQLPRPKNALGHEIMSGHAVDPYVEVSLYVPDWPSVSSAAAVSRSSSVSKGKQRRGSSAGAAGVTGAPPNGSTSATAGVGAEPGPVATLMPPATLAPTVIPGKTISYKTGAVKNNGFNPVWEEKLSIPFNCVGEMLDLVFVRFVVRRQEDKEGDEPLAIYCASLGSLGRGYRHLPLHDSQLSQYLFSTLFVRINL